MCVIHQASRGGRLTSAPLCIKKWYWHEMMRSTYYMCTQHVQRPWGGLGGKYGEGLEEVQVAVTQSRAWGFERRGAWSPATTALWVVVKFLVLRGMGSH